MKFLNCHKYDILEENDELINSDLLYYGEFTNNYLFPENCSNDELSSMFFRSYLEIITEKLFKKNKILQKKTK